MGKKTLIIFFILFLAFVNQGCVVSKQVGVTGFPYILRESKILMDQTFYSAGAKESGDSAKSTGSEMTVKIEPNSDEAAGGTKKVYLTFDDGPDSVVTPLILDTLDSYGIRATFFVVGTEIEKHPEILRDMAERGHSIGNHTFNHRYQGIYSGKNSLMESLRKNEETIFRITGKRPQIVRDPGGAVRKSGSAKKFLAEEGYRLVDWNVESYDSRKPYLTAPEIIEKIRQQSLKEDLWPEMIIIMHDGTGHMATARALPTVIGMLQNQGFQFETMK
ncbi:polysaccharide deacetylase family protein [Phosphitispora fastidiosa]|uniref:polysaccharide deacetylase family protein n=1 Tax=Phosphitispora fastidiosa TaxID=2837202 RepID=UPI001E586193|nr:polysaccharide deacetylase family protein [Phosphitispora fastidiosa]MBU7006483.1 peptidoglycan/xylan/chitin deacetylase (PgdA/CDA1 family) [Phosphitispora fastidiosa]